MTAIGLSFVGGVLFGLVGLLAGPVGLGVMLFFSKKTVASENDVPEIWGHAQDQPCNCRSSPCVWTKVMLNGLWLNEESCPRCGCYMLKRFDYHRVNVSVHCEICANCGRYARPVLARDECIEPPIVGSCFAGAVLHEHVSLLPGKPTKSCR